MVTRIEVPTRPTVRGIFSQYFNPGRTPNCYLLPNGYEFRVEIVGDDVVCDFAGLGWISIRGYHPQFINVEHLLRHYRLISGELILRYGKIRDRKTPPQEKGTILWKG